EAQQRLGAISTAAELESVKASFVGPNGTFTQIRKQIGKIPPEDRPAAGRLINETKQALDAFFSAALERLRQEELRRKLGPAVDPTLLPQRLEGSRHLITQIREELCSIMARAGFHVAEGPEVETE